MKKIIFLLSSLIISISFINAQIKSYISIESGATISGISERISNNMTTCGLGNNIKYEPFWFLIFYFPGSNKQYPIKEPMKSNYKIRYGFNIKEQVSIEAGFGHTYRTKVEGAAATGNFTNYLDIQTDLSTLYTAYMWKNKKGNRSVGLGPAVSLCNIKQSSPYNANLLFDKNCVLPGAIFTGCWNFVNTKSWIMGFRSDMTITLPAKIPEVKITHSDNKGFVSVFKCTNIAAVINTLSISSGIKF